MVRTRSGGLTEPGPILFTAFEPSGDDHAAAIITQLKLAHPGARIYAWGGPKMAAAGAEVIERTGDDAVMGMPGLAKIREHQRINQRVAAWMDEHRPVVHVPVDSPAANFPICALAKERGVRVVHMVAPQIWAWGTWRIRKLRRLTDLVLCVLPFEPEFFESRNVPAKFIGHQLFDNEIPADELDDAGRDWPRGDSNVLLLPGSRPAEIEHNFPLLLETFRTLHRERRGVRGLVAVTRPEVEDVLRGLASQSDRAAGGASADGWPEGLTVVSAETDAAVRWCDLALVVSGTVTLQVAKQAKPMVIVYKSSQLLYTLIGRWLLRTRLFTLPNLIARRRIVPELVPHFGGAGPVIDAALGLLERPEEAERQRAALREIAGAFDGKHASKLAAAAIAEMAGIEGSTPSEASKSPGRPAPASRASA